MFKLVCQVGLLFRWLYFYPVTELFRNDCSELAWSVENAAQLLGAVLTEGSGRGTSCGRAVPGVERQARKGSSAVG